MLNANSVVCADNCREIEKLGEYMWENFQLDGQYFNIVRGETLAGDEIKQVPPDSLPRMYSYASQLTKRYGDRMFADDDGPKRFAKNGAYVGTITTQYRTQRANFDRLAVWRVPCTPCGTIAGINCIENER